MVLAVVVALPSRLLKFPNTGGSWSTGSAIRNLGSGIRNSESEI